MTGAVAYAHRQANGRAPTPRFQLVAYDDITIGSAPAYVVRGVLPRVGVVAVWGPPKHGKTFAVYDLVLHVARGRPYRGRRVQPGPVVYFVAEGPFGFRNRKAAYHQERVGVEEPSPPFYMIDASLVLVKDHALLAKEIKEQLGAEAPCIIAIDTVNRTFTGSESSDEHMTAYVNAAHYLRAQFQCCVLLVHHTGLDETRMRGHTSLLGAVDASLSVKRDKDDRVVMTVEHMKDGPTGDTFVSVLRPVTVGIDDDGEDITSCVLDHVVEEPAARKAEVAKPPRMPAAATIALAALRQAILEEGAIPTPNEKIPGNVRCATTNQWRRYAYAKGISDGEERAKRLAFQRACQSLIANRHVAQWGDFAWTVKS